MTWLAVLAWCAWLVELARSTTSTSPGTSEVAKPCPWLVELIPPPTQGCARLFRPAAAITVDQPATFLLFAPPTSACGAVVVPPCLPGNASGGLGAPYEVAPASFFKLSLGSSTAYTMSVDMAPIGKEHWYSFSLFPIKAGVANLDVYIDFTDCEDMYGMNIADHFANVTAAAQGSFPWRGCKSTPFARVGTYSIPVLLSARGVASSRPPSCDWSRLMGGWRLNSDQTPHFFRAANCRRSIRFAGSGDSNGHAGRRRPVSFTGTEPPVPPAVCVIGDSNIINSWKNVYLPLAPTHWLDPVLEGGGIDFDMKQDKMLSLGEPVPGTWLRGDETLWGAHNAQHVVGHGPRRFSVPSLLRGPTAGLAHAVLDFERSPWQRCTDEKLRGNASAPVQAVVFHSGSHNCGGSYAEAREAMRHLVALFDRWSAPDKCLVVVSTPDPYHEAIRAHTGYGGQEHFRNSFRVNALNEAMRRELSAVRGRSVHFLDTFHLSLGLHFSGHNKPPRARPASAALPGEAHGEPLSQPVLGPVLDPVHFHPEHVNSELAKVVWEATVDLCGLRPSGDDGDRRQRRQRRQRRRFRR